MEQPEMNPNIPSVVTPAVRTNIPGSNKRKRFKCPCGISYCNNGVIQQLLEDAGCHDLLTVRTVAIVDNPTTHQERKSYALCQAIERHLHISRDVASAKHESKLKTYEIHKFHWPIVLLNKKFRPSTLLNINEVQAINNEQSLLYGISNNSLEDKVNLFGFIVASLVPDVSCLSPDEQNDMKCFVQAPVATKSDIETYIAAVTSSRSTRLVNRQRVEPPAAVDTNDNPIMQSPLNSRCLFPIGESPDFVQSEEDLVANLAQKFDRYQHTGRLSDEFLDNAQVKQACHNLATAYKRETPICLGTKLVPSPNYASGLCWLFICSCGKASIGNTNNGPRKCPMCRKRAERRQSQLLNAEKLADPSSNANFGKMITPVKVMLKENLRKSLLHHRRRTARLQKAISELKQKETFSLNENDTDGNALLDTITTHFSNDPGKMKEVIKSLFAKNPSAIANNVSEDEADDFTEHIVTEICNYRLVLDQKKTQVRFSPRILRLALSLWMRTPSGYDVFRRQSITVMPSPSLLKKINKEMAVNEGKCPKISIQ